MRIAYFASSVIPSQKANSIQVIKMCNAFSELGHEVTLFAKSSENSNNCSINKLKEYYGIKNSFELYTLSASNIRLLGGLEYGYKVYKKITDLKIDFDIFYGRNLYALTFCQNLNRPLIYESHAKPSPGRKILENHLFSKPNFKLLVVINKALYDYYINNFPILKSNPQKVLLAPDGADLTERFTNNKNKIPLIGYAGSLYPGKGIETIIKIAEEMPEYNFAIAGGTDSQIKEIKQNSNLKNIFFEGFLPPSQIPQFLSKCDILFTDYSSILFDYCLLDKPVGHIIHDWDYFIHNDHEQFIYKNPEELMYGTKIHNLEELIAFITNPMQNNNELRESINVKYNDDPYLEESSTLKFIKEVLHEKI